MDVKFYFKLKEPDGGIRYPHGATTEGIGVLPTTLCVYFTVNLLWDVSPYNRFHHVQFIMSICGSGWIRTTDPKSRFILARKCSTKMSFASYMSTKKFLSFGRKFFQTIFTYGATNSVTISPPKGYYVFVGSNEFLVSHDESFNFPREQKLQDTVSFITFSLIMFIYIFPSPLKIH
jgi:hypothetical protein